MGYVYYGNYATYYEVGRVECLRSLGLPYKELEDQGILMPVLENRSKYIKPGKYDDLLSIKVMIPTLPGVRIKFEYEVYNQDDVLINIGETTLVFIDAKTGKPTRLPNAFIELMKPYFS